MVNPEKPNNAPVPVEGGGGPEHLLPPIHVRMGEPFAIFEPNRMPNLGAVRFAYERPFTLEGVGEGYVRIVDVGSADLESLYMFISIPQVLQSYDAPFGVHYFTSFCSPDTPLEQRYTISPLRLQEIRLSLNQPKEVKASPVVAVDFQITEATSYRYWAVDALADPSDRLCYNPNSAAYWEWHFEKTGEARYVAFPREADKVVGIHLTFFPHELLELASETGSDRGQNADDIPPLIFNDVATFDVGFWEEVSPKIESLVRKMRCSSRSRMGQ